MTILYSREGLKPHLTVQREIVTARGFEERFVYKDWPRGTEVTIVIRQTGSSVGARRDWVTLGMTPWAVRYNLLTDTAFPHFTFVLNRNAAISITGRSASGSSFPIGTSRLKDLYRQLYFSDIDLGPVRPGSLSRRTTRVVPTFKILRPQYPFTPITQRPDQIHELVSEAQIYFPWEPKTKDGRILSIPIKDPDPKKIKKQVSRRRRGKKSEDRGEYTITSNGNGHVIQSIANNYAFRISPIERQGSNRTPAYNFELTSEPRKKTVGRIDSEMEITVDTVRLYVHHNDAVAVTKQASGLHHVDAEVLTLNENGTTRIGYLGTPLPSKSRFKSMSKSSSVSGILFGVASLALAFIPGWGWIASLALSAGELVYTYHTGQDFFGDKVSPKQLAAMGILGILGAAGDVVAGIRVAGRTISLSDDFNDAMRAAFRQVSHEYEAAARGSAEAVATVGDQPIAKLIASLNDKQRKQLVAAANRMRSTDEFLQTIGRLLDDQFKVLAKADSEQAQLVFASILEQLLTPDGKTFANKFLREAYAKFLSNPRRKHGRHPLVWLHTQGSKPVIEFLEAALGKNYRVTVAAALKASKGRHVTLATSDNISQVFAAYDTIVSMGLRPYKELRAEWTKAIYDDVRSLMRDVFELEHPVELRFARNLDGKRRFRPVTSKAKEPRFTLDPNPQGINVRDEFQAFIVPRTVRHAVLLSEEGLATGAIKKGSAFLYTQHPKTGNVKALIPHGAEHLVSPQQIADAVCTEILRVNFAKIGSPGQIDNIMTRLEADFKTLTSLINTARKTNFPEPVLIRSLKDMDPALKPGAKGWPRFGRNRRSGDYDKVVNRAEVQAAMKAREKWARRQRKLRASD